MIFVFLRGGEPVHVVLLELVTEQHDTSEPDAWCKRLGCDRWEAVPAFDIADDWQSLKALHTARRAAILNDLLSPPFDSGCYGD